MPNTVPGTRRSLVAGFAVTAALLASLLPFSTAFAAVPTVLSVNRVQATPTNADTLQWTATFSEAVAGVDASDFALAATGTAAGGVPVVSGGPTVYTITVSTVVGDGTLGLNVLAGGITSVSTSQLLAVGFTGQVYTVDNTVPGPPGTPDLDPSSDNGTVNTDNQTSDTTPTFNGTSEANATVALFAGATQVGTTVASGGGTWTITSSTLAAATYSFTAVQTDAAGNGPSVASAGLSVTISNVPAPSQPDLATASDTGSSTTDNITFDTTPTFNGTAEAATLIELYAGATLVGSATSDGSGNWSITSSALGSGTYAFTAREVSVNGTGPASTGLSVTIYPPGSLTVTVNQALTQHDPTAQSPINFSVIFSNPVADFASVDVTVGGTAPGVKTATITGSGTGYNVAITGMTGSGTVIVSLAAGVTNDAAGNASAASTPIDNTVTYDITAGPSVAINQAAGQADPTGVAPINFTAVFSASVTGFDGSDVALSGTAGATTATVTGSGTTYNVAVTGMTTGGTVIASIPADAAASSIGNHPSLASTSTDNTVTFRLASKWLVTASTYTPAPSQAITITAQLADASGNAVPSLGVVVTWTSTGGGTFSAATSTTNASGVATVTFTVSATTGTVHTVTATGGGFTGTSSTITVALPGANIVLTSSASRTTYRAFVTLTLQFAASGANRTVQLQRLSPADANWVTIANLTTNASGIAAYSYGPPYNTQFRAVFAGAAGLGAGTSNVVAVNVYHAAQTRPASRSTQSIAHGTRITYTAVIRPKAPAGTQSATFLIYKRVGGAWVFQTSATKVLSSGSATFSWTWSKTGDWYIRVRANATRYNLASLSPIVRYSVK